MMLMSVGRYLVLMVFMVLLFHWLSDIVESPLLVQWLINILHDNIGGLRYVAFALIIQFCVIKFVKLSLRDANHIAGACLQLCIVTNAALNIYNEYFGLRDRAQLDADFINGIVDVFYGYFLYDTGFVLAVDGINEFFFHHLISLLMIILTYRLGVPETFYHNIYGFCVELANPCLHVRHVTEKYNKIHRINLKLIFFLYTTARIILNPITVYLFFANVPIADDFVYYGLLATGVAVYIMTLLWYKKVIRMCLSHNSSRPESRNLSKNK